MHNDYGHGCYTMENEKEYKLNFCRIFWLIILSTCTGSFFVWAAMEYFK